MILCAATEQTCFLRRLSLHGEGEEVRLYSRKLSRVRQGVILAGGLLTFFLLAFISGRISAKGDWAAFLVKEQLNYWLFICCFSRTIRPACDSIETAESLTHPPFKPPNNFLYNSIKQGYRLDEFSTSSQTIVTRLNLKKRERAILWSKRKAE